MALIFVSYRRGDSSGHAGRLYDHLCRKFGEGEVFFDLDTITSGENWQSLLRIGLYESKVLLVLIGRRWQCKRLQDPEDYVRREILWAMERQLAVIPVLLEGAKPPAPDRLPVELRFLSERQAHRLDDQTNRTWLQDLEALVVRMHEILQGEIRRRTLRQTTKIYLKRADERDYGFDFEVHGHGIPQLMVPPGKSADFEISPGRLTFYVSFFNDLLVGQYQFIASGRSDVWEGTLEAGTYEFECGTLKRPWFIWLLARHNYRVFLRQVSYLPWADLAAGR